jgi:hypothetical protein
LAWQPGDSGRFDRDSAARQPPKPPPFAKTREAADLRAHEQRGAATIGREEFSWGDSSLLRHLMRCAALSDRTDKPKPGGKIMQTLVAVYPSRAQAEQMMGMLIEHGLASDKIALSPENEAGEAPRET